MRPLDLLLHSRAAAGGGAERVIASIAAGLAGRGHRVVLAVDDGAGAPAAAGVEVVTLGPSHPRGVAALARLMRRRRFDAALGAVSVSNVKLLAARTLARPSLPVVVSYHGFEEWRTGRLSALAYRGMPVIRRAAARIVAVSDGLRDDLVARWGADPARTVRIYNPVPLADAAAVPTAAALAARAPVVAALGRLSAEKGMDDLLTAFAGVATAGARLVIGGDGPERAALAGLAERLGIAGRVTLAGAVPGPEAVFSDARLAVSPSRTEAFGNAVVEALGYGLPVVATDCAGPREILGDGRHGRLVPVGAPAALAAAIDAALAASADPAASRARAEVFALERGLDAWEGLLAEVVAGR